MQAFLALLVFCGVLCHNPAAAESRWSILRQSDYDLKIERAGLEYVNSSNYVKYAKLDAVPYNRTLRALNASFELRRDMNKQILAEESRWSILRQSDYDLKIERAGMEYVNSYYAKYAKLDAVPYNRTLRAFNASFEFRRDMNKQILVEVKCFKFLSNEYRYFPVNFQFDLCTEYNQDSFGLKYLMDRSSNMHPCFFKKDTHYYVDNGLPDFSKFPPHIPFGRYSVHLLTLDKSNKSNKIGDAAVYIEIKEKPVKWKLL